MGCAGEARGAGTRVAVGYEEKGAGAGCGSWSYRRHGQWTEDDEEGVWALRWTTLGTAAWMPILERYSHVVTCCPV